MMEISNFRAQENRSRAREQDARSVAATKHVYAGQVQVLGAGESTYFVKFPVVYCDKPLFSCGGELVAGQEPKDGSFPTTNCMVIGWDIFDHPPVNVYYRGARLAIVTGGLPDQLSIVHFRFEGMALVNPVGSLSTLEGSL